MTQRKKISLVVFSSDGIKTTLNNTLIKKYLKKIQNILCNFKQDRKQKILESKDQLRIGKNSFQSNNKGQIHNVHMIDIQINKR